MDHENCKIKTLYRSVDNRKVFGICGGIAEYLDIDPALMRILLLVFTIFGGGLFLLMYIILYFIIPSRNGTRQPLTLDVASFKDKRIKRIVNNRILAGVCGGLGNYLSIDPTIIRIIFVILDILTGILPLLVLYLTMIWVIPLDMDQLEKSS